MGLKPHTRTKKGTFRVGRSDELAKNLAKDYPEYRKVDPRTKQGTLEKRLGTNSINTTRKALRKLNK